MGIHEIMAGLLAAPPSMRQVEIYLAEIAGKPVSVSILEKEFELTEHDAKVIMYKLITEGRVKGVYLVKHDCRDRGYPQIVETRDYLSGYAAPPWTCPHCRTQILEGTIGYELGGLVPEGFIARC